MNYGNYFAKLWSSKRPDLTMTSFARELGVTQPFVKQIEMNIRSPRKEMRDKMIRILGLKGKECDDFIYNSILFRLDDSDEGDMIRLQRKGYF
jgi:transcriptional regulator with XRE-family HTH domain